VLVADAVVSTGGTSSDPVNFFAPCMSMTDCDVGPSPAAPAALLTIHAAVAVAKQTAATKKVGDLSECIS
jgi:hypothetical protein